MNMSDVPEGKSAEMPRADQLAAAIPDNIKAGLDTEKIENIVKAAIGNPEAMKADDYSKLILIDNLPSKYLRYPEGTKLYGRALDIRQLKKLANMTQTNATSIIDDIIRGTIKGITFDNILVSDKLYIILWLRANTYPESGYSVPFFCDQCNSMQTYDFKVDNIGINYIREDMAFEEPLELPGGDFITFKYPTIKDEERIKKFRESMKKSFEKYDSDTLALCMTVNEINGKSLSLIETYEYVSNIKIYSQIKGFVSEFDFGISDELTVTCNSCGGTAQVGLSFREDFFIPAYRFGKYSRNGIQNK